MADSKLVHLDNQPKLLDARRRLDELESAANAAEREHREAMNAANAPEEGVDDLAEKLIRGEPLVIVERPTQTRLAQLRAAALVARRAADKQALLLEELHASFVREACASIKPEFAKLAQRFAAAALELQAIARDTEAKYATLVAAGYRSHGPWAAQASEESCDTIARALAAPSNDIASLHCSLRATIRALAGFELLPQKHPAVIAAMKL